MLPVDKVPAFVETLDRTMGLWPLWFCPLRNVPTPPRCPPPHPSPVRVPKLSGRERAEVEGGDCVERLVRHRVLP